MKITKSSPIASFEEFKKQASKTKRFVSFPRNQRYEISRIEGDIIYFIRLDANSAREWSFNFKDVYKAYIELEDFKTQSFKKYVPTRHSPARGLLIHLKFLNVK